MKFDNIKDKANYFRNLTDFRLMPNTYVLMMLDGRAFSAYIKHHFDIPFDDTFISMMNQTAAYLCKNICGCKAAYVQSDEISLVLTDFDTTSTGAFFDYRLSKLQSIAASMAAAKFNQLLIANELKKNPDIAIEDIKIVQFDCKAWNVPTINDVFVWFLYRQLDCIRNSKQQFCQTYMPHKKLEKLSTDEQVAKTIVETNHDWNQCENYQKYGRLIIKNQHEKEVEVNGEHTTCLRKAWDIMPAIQFNGITYDDFANMCHIPQIMMKEE